MRIQRPQTSTLFPCTSLFRSRSRKGRGNPSVDQEVLNQSPPISGTSAWRSDPLLIQLGEAFSESVRKEMEVLGRRSEEHTSELQSREYRVWRLLPQNQRRALC